ncbi:MAG: putative DNA binding domain-containing protein [Planctomycetes bacterium]|nr:putative DNA binding domain-containing protein [Planctomycetota bacterium]
MAGGKLTRALETIVAFANTDGGYLILGLEDPDKGEGRDRVYGIQENPDNIDELQRHITSKITPAIDPPSFIPIGCTLRDGSAGSIVIVSVDKGADVHSIVLGGTWIRLNTGNRQMTAEEITRLRFERGRVTAETQLADVSFELLDTDYWRAYATKRRLSRDLPDALLHLGLAKQTAQGELHPTHAAVLLFAEQPSGLLATKAAVRVFHYKGERIERDTAPNLQKPPVSFSGPLLTQISEAYQYVLNELATGVQMGPLGFEIVQQYPVRVIREAITNAVIHRDYSIPTDIQVRLFADRIEVDSPGTLPGKVTVQNINTLGSVSRNPLIVSHLREFPDPPNLDAGEGVRMMFHTMGAAGLYPPQYLTRATTGRDSVTVQLLNEARPTVWDQVCSWLDDHGTIGNAEVRQIMKTDDVLAASKALKGWVERGLLAVANPLGGKRNRRYQRPESEALQPLFARRLRKQNARGS